MLYNNMQTITNRGNNEIYWERKNKFIINANIIVIP